LQVSFTRHSTPWSPQGAPLGAIFVWQVPAPSQVSRPLHALLVLLPQVDPAARGGLEQVPFAHTSSVQALPSEHSAALTQPPTVNVTVQLVPVEKPAAMKKGYVPGPTGTPAKLPLDVSTWALFHVAEPLKSPPDTVQRTPTRLAAAGTVTWK
jgi:hypothetical protein